jgi:hypothetical protein
LKSISPPRLKDFSEMMKEASRNAKALKVKSSDVSRAIQKVRREK